ncbi:MAG TPA: glycosyl hydrolase family 18 protein [Micromonosporaceae bacterium]
MTGRTRPALLAAAAAAVVTLAVATVVGLAQPAQATSNILTNPGFETGTLTGWQCDAGDSVTTGHAHSGSYALAGTPTSSATAQCAQTVPVQPGTSYTLSGYVDGSYVYLGVTGTGTSDGNNWTPGTGGGYAPLSYTFTTGATTTSVTVYVHGWYIQPTFYADDLVLSGPGSTPSPSPTTASPSPSSSPSPSTSPSPTPTPSPSTSSPPPSGGSLPKHELTGYWQDFTNGARPLRLSDVPTSYNLVAVAFADADPSRPGGVTFGVDSGLSSALGGYSAADFKADVATLHARGQKVVVSVGGQNGTVSVGDSTAAANFASSVYGLMTTWGFDGVDIDVENGLNATYMASALRQLSGKVGASLIITLAPQTIDMQSTGYAYFQLALNIKDILTVVHTQYYNSGSMLGCDQQVYSQGTENFLTALACIQLQNGLRPDQVALGLPASGSAAGGGYVSPTVVNAALDCLARGTNCGSFRPPATWPAIRGAMTWSINWDASNGYGFATTVAPHLGTLP